MREPNDIVFLLSGYGYVNFNNVLVLGPRLIARIEIGLDRGKWKSPVKRYHDYTTSQTCDFFTIAKVTQMYLTLSKERNFE